MKTGKNGHLTEGHTTESKWQKSVIAVVMAILKRKLKYPLIAK